jgi:hypothetical protein
MFSSKTFVIVLGVGLGLAVSCLAMAYGQENTDGTQKAAWAKLQNMAGVWKGTDEAEKDPSNIVREFEPIVQGNFLLVRTESVSARETHADWAVFSFDKARNKVMMRQFVSEGYVNRFALDEVSQDGNTLVFVTEHCENAPPGFRVRMTYTLQGENEFTQALDLAPPGSDFKRCVGGRLRRQ